MAGRQGISILAAASLATLIAAGLLASPEPGTTRGSGNGPDVTVHFLPSVSHYGPEGGVHSYAVGTTSCNIGNEPLWWCDNDRAYCDDDQHPVIAQNIYRLKGGRFEQLGMSWLKHGFLALANSDSECGDGSCDSPPHGGDQLGVGCTDPYSSGLNGNRFLGRRSEVQPVEGTFPYPFTQVPYSGALDQRIKVEEVDLDPVLNPGAQYWIEGQYVAADDAESGNAFNNASHREVLVQSGTYNLLPVGPTVRTKPAVFAWQTVDPEVQIIELEDSRSELFHAARKVTIGRGNAHFEYVVHNLNSDRAANRFTVAFKTPTTITNAGFRDVDHHSGEPYATTDWTIDVDGSSVSWSTDDFATDQDANALRWGTMFSFWFDATVNTLGDDVVHTLGMFKPGEPAEITIPFAGDSNVIFFDGFETGDSSGWD